MQAPMTLGEKLDGLGKPQTETASIGWKRAVLYSVLNRILLLCFIGVLVVWAMLGSAADTIIMLEILGALIVLWLIVQNSRMAQPRKAKRRKAPHFLLEHDRQRFMRDLRLDAKTAVLDGSNVYHFGRANGLDAQPLGLVAEQLRQEGYRVVCFFDANIFHTLQEHGAFSEKTRHDLRLLMDIFGLGAHEIYVVPSGVQADPFVLNTLRHLPISFAVTNDQFRDYAKEYAEVMHGDQWRKGLSISKNEIKMHKHKFKTPVYVT